MDIKKSNYISPEDILEASNSLDVSDHWSNASFRLGAEWAIKRLAEPFSSDDSLYPDLCYIGYAADKSLIMVLEAKLKTAKEALEFYAKKENWERINVSQGPFHFQTVWASNLKYQDCALYNAGGGRARLALKEINQ